MRKLILILILPSALQALQIPKSSLEVVKSELEAKLVDAKKTNQPALIKKYQADLTKLSKKIKHFETEWLNYRKRQLQQRPSSAKVTQEISEINQLLKSRN